MKKVFFFFIGIVFSLTCRSQQVNLNGANIMLPNGVEKLSKKEMSDYAHNKYENDNLILKTVAMKFDSGQLYKLDDIIFSLNNEKGHFEGNYLSNTKSGFDEMAHHSKNYLSIIKTIGNNQVLITNHIVKNIEYYNFFCINDHDTIVITGSFQFTKSDEVEAIDMVSKMLASLNFTE